MLQSCESCVSLVSSELTEISTVSPISSDYFAGFSSALDSTITAASESNAITNKTEFENAAGSLCAKTKLMPVSDKRTSRCSSPGKLGHSVGIAIQNSVTCNFRQLQPINSNLDIFDFIDIDNKHKNSRQYKISNEMNDFTTFDPFPSNNTGSKLKYSNKRASLPVSKQDFSFFLPEVDVLNNDNIIDYNKSKSSTTLEELESQDSKHNTTVKKFRARRRSINFSLPLSKQTLLSGYASTEQDHEYQNLVQSIDLKQLVKAHEEAKTSEGYIKLTALENMEKNQKSSAQGDFNSFDKNSKENPQPNVLISPATCNEKVDTAKLGFTKVLKQHCPVDLQKKFPFREPETSLSGQNTRSISGVKQKNNKEQSHNRSLTEFQSPKNNTRSHVYQNNTAFGKTNDNTINTKKSGHFFESLPLASPQTDNYNNENEVDELKKKKKQQANKTVEGCKRRFSISFKRFSLLKGMSGNMKRKTETVTE